MGVKVNGPASSRFAFLYRNPALQLVETHRRIPAARTTPMPPQDDKTSSPLQKTTALNTSAAGK